MRKWIETIITNIRAIWVKWTTLQRIIFCAIVAVVVGSFLALFAIGTAPSATPLLTRPIADPELLDRIAVRLDRENVPYQITSDQRILLDSERTARRMRALLAREDLIPVETDPWELFDIDRWTQTDFERNVNLQRSIIRQVEQHIAALNDVDAVNVTLVIPTPELFVEDQNPVTASVIISPKPGSDIRENRSKIEGIQKLIRFAVEGLSPENITITDRRGIELNDFENAGTGDRIVQTRRELEVEREFEQSLINQIHVSLAGIYGSKRVKIINIDVTLNMGRRTQETEEHFPIVTVPDNPLTPFDERQIVLAIPRSTEEVSENYEGTGFNPEGPPGQEGQTPPAYRDLEGLVGRWSNEEQRINNEVNTVKTYEEKSPEITRITAGVALDGVWEWVYDENGAIEIESDGSIKREYVPVSDEELAQAERLVRDAIGYDQTRNDSISVRHIQFDRIDEQRAEDEAHRRSIQIRLLVIYSAIGIAVLLALFIVSRLVIREIERRHRLREDELERQQALMNERALQSEEEGREVPMSDEDRARLELQETVIDLVRGHPDDAARLLKMWLVE